MFNTNSSLVLMAFLSFLLISCGVQEKKSVPAKVNQEEIAKQLNNVVKPPEQLAQYICKIFEDSNGNIWFGTLGRGVAFYDGKNLRYYNVEDGLVGNAVVSIVEDKKGNIWIATQSGLSKYDGKTFKNYTAEDGLVDNRVSNLLIDKEGIIWIGTWGGISQFDGKSFSTFNIPIPNIKIENYQSTMHWITELMEDQYGNIWIGRDGYGATKYDGTSFTHFSKADGLESNNIQSIVEDQEGRIWFGSRITERDHPDQDKRVGEAGLNLYDGQMMTNFQEFEGLNKNDLYCIYPDDNGVIWIGAIGVGLYKYEADKFVLYYKTDRMDITQSHAIQGILKDSKDRLWLGYNGGLFQMKHDEIINITPSDLGFQK